MEHYLLCLGLPNTHTQDISHLTVCPKPLVLLARHVFPPSPFTPFWLEGINNTTGINPAEKRWSARKCGFTQCCHLAADAQGQKECCLPPLASASLLGTWRTIQIWIENGIENCWWQNYIYIYVRMYVCVYKKLCHVFNNSGQQTRWKWALQLNVQVFLLYMKRRMLCTEKLVQTVIGSSVFCHQGSM